MSGAWTDEAYVKTVAKTCADIRYLYWYWKEILPKQEADLDKLLDEIYAGIPVEDFIDRINDGTFPDTSHIHKLQEQYDNQLDFNLHKLLSLRHELWT